MVITSSLRPGSNSDALADAFARGASYVTCGSIAVRDPDLAALWIDRWKERIILGADCIDGLVSSGAWMDRSSLDVVEFILKYMALGVGMCISTDISKDGMLSGPGYELYGRILSSCPGHNSPGQETPLNPKYLH